jgi:hypothetical protein
MNDEELRQQIKGKVLNVESAWNRRVKRNGRSI